MAMLMNVYLSGPCNKENIFLGLIEYEQNTNRIVCFAPRKLYIISSYSIRPLKIFTKYTIDLRDNIREIIVK